MIHLQAVSCFDVLLLLVLEFLLSSRVYLMPFQEYSSLAIVRCQFFIDGRVCNVRADNGSLVSLKFLFGFVNQRISLSLQLLADRNHVYVGSVIPKHYPHRIHLVFIPTQTCPALASKTVAIMTSQERRRRVRIEQRRSRLRLLAEVKGE